MSKNKNKTYKLFKPKNKQNKQFINKIIKKDIIMYTVLVFSLVVLTATSSYAFLSTEVNTVELENIVSSTIEGVEVTNKEIELNNINPSTESEVISSLPSCKKDEIEICSMYEFTIDNTNTEVAKNIKYTLTNINNTFHNLKFKVYQGNKEDITSSSVSLYNSDKLNPNIKELELTGLINTVKAKNSLTYTIVFYVEKIENQEMYDANKEFNANILIDLKTSGNVGE